MSAAAARSTTADVVSLDDYRRMREQQRGATPAPVVRSAAPVAAMRSPMWVYWVPVWIW